MTLDGILNEVKEKLTQSQLFSGVKIIGAFENKLKPTKLKNPVISLGIDSVDLSSDSIDESSRNGEIKIFADIFVPLNGSALNTQDIFLNICKTLSCYNVLSVTAQRLVVDETTQTFLLKTNVCFRDTLEFGGA